MQVNNNYSQSLNNNLMNVLKFEFLSKLRTIKSGRRSALEVGEIIELDLSSFTDDMEEEEALKTIVFGGNMKLLTLLSFLVEDGTELVNDTANGMVLTKYKGTTKTLHQFLLENELDLPEKVTVVQRPVEGASREYLTKNPENKLRAYKHLGINCEGETFPYIRIKETGLDATDPKNYQMNRPFTMVEIAKV